MLAYSTYDSPIGKLKIVVKDDRLFQLQLMPTSKTMQNSEPFEDQLEDPIIQATKNWLDAYFAGQNPPLDLKLEFNGTDYQIAVWNALLEIPYGQIVSYQDLANRLKVLLGRDNVSARGVGQAVKRNPIAIYVPCHRVIGSNHQLVGYFYGLEIKKYLLELEGVSVENKSQKTAFK